MKIRLGFVSNSSSSSFVINKSDLTDEQIYKINNYFKIVSESSEKERHRIGWDETRWRIGESENYITGKTEMDNFDMWFYLTDIGISDDKIEWPA